jgi:hypothetical protein
MAEGDKISASDTYVLDDELLDEMDSIELTGLLDELSEKFGADASSGSENEDEQSDADPTVADIDVVDSDDDSI